MSGCPPRRWGAVIVMLALVLLAPACSSKETSLVVYAAASLKAPFETFAKTFEDTHPGVTVTLQTGGSSTLATQIVEGAPVDVFASAGPEPMQTVKKANLAGHVDDFATNTLLLITPKTNPAGIGSIEQLTRPSVKTVICQPEVPCGALTKQVLERKGVTLKPASLEKDVTAVLTKVRLGEADAGFVYSTDAKAAGTDVYVVDDPVFKELATVYPMTIPTGAKNPNLAAEFTALVLSQPGQSLLADHGFGAP